MKRPTEVAILSRVENASKEQLIEKANQLSQVASLRGKFDVIFEDTTAASIGRSDKYQSANGEIIVQRPASIYLKIEAPVVKIDITQMTSNGKSFRVAILEDGGSGKYKRFLLGSNDADYSLLQKSVSDIEIGGPENSKMAKKNVSAFANIRPQHFTDALLIKPLVPSPEVFYVQSEIFQVESTSDIPKKASLVNRGYYLLEELKKKGDDLILSRRFWFDRTDSMRMTRQQIYTDDGVLDSDISYEDAVQVTQSKEYIVPKKIKVTRPKDQYKITLSYQEPEAVVIGKEWKAEIFNLQNRWSLPEVDLDKKLTEAQQNGSQAKSAGP